MQHYRNLGQSGLHGLCGFWKSLDRFGQLSRTKNDSNCLDIKLKVFKREDKNAEFRLRWNFNMGENDFNQFIWQTNQLVVEANLFFREQKLPPFLQPALSKDMEEQLKLVHNVIDIVDCPKRRVCVTLLRYKVDKPETSYAQIWLSGRMTVEKKFQQFVYVIYKLAEFVCLLDVLNSMYDKVIAKQLICNVLWKVIATIYSIQLFFVYESGRVRTLEKIETSFSS